MAFLVQRGFFLLSEKEAAMSPGGYFVVKVARNVEDVELDEETLFLFFLVCFFSSYCYSYYQPETSERLVGVLSPEDCCINKCSQSIQAIYF